MHYRRQLAELEAQAWIQANPKIRGLSASSEAQPILKNTKKRAYANGSARSYATKTTR